MSAWSVVRDVAIVILITLNTKESGSCCCRICEQLGRDFFVRGRCVLSVMTRTERVNASTGAGIKTGGWMKGRQIDMDEEKAGINSALYSKLGFFSL